MSSHLLSRDYGSGAFQRRLASCIKVSLGQLQGALSKLQPWLSVWLTTWCVRIDWQPEVRQRMLTLSAGVLLGPCSGSAKDQVKCVRLNLAHGSSFC